MLDGLRVITGSRRRACAGSRARRRSGPRGTDRRKPSDSDSSDAQARFNSARHARPGTSMPAVMIYVQHLLGIGHLMRARLIAEALADTGFDVHLVSGGMPIGGRLPRNVRTVQLPPIRVTDASFTPLRDAQYAPIDDAYRDTRRELLLAAYESAAPAAVLFETFPFGRRSLRFELVPLLERIEATRPRPLVVASVREILQVQPKPEREREMLEWATRWFDAILVHGDPRFARFEDTYPLAAKLSPPLHYTGFVLSPPPAACRAVRQAAGAKSSCRRAAVRSASSCSRRRSQRKRSSRFGHLTWRVLAGPNIPEAGFQRLLREAGPNAVVERARVDFASLLRQAFVSVSQGGYNTVLDVVTSGARPVVVPFTGSGETEQRARGERLRDFGLAVVVDDRTITPQSLAAAVDAAGSREQWGLLEFRQRRRGALRGVHRRTARDRASGAGGARDMNAWSRLDGELEAWRASGRRATLWLRDDDACDDSAALRRLLDITHASDVPITLAVIPAALGSGLVDAVAQFANATIVQHGYAHANHAPSGARSCELGAAPRGGYFGRRARRGSRPARGRFRSALLCGAGSAVESHRRRRGGAAARRRLPRTVDIRAADRPLRGSRTRAMQRACRRDRLAPRPGVHRSAGRDRPRGRTPAGAPGGERGSD